MHLQTHVMRFRCCTSIVEGAKQLSLQSYPQQSLVQDDHVDLPATFTTDYDKFTLKKALDGNGLTLSQVHSALHRHEGRKLCASYLGNPLQL